MKTNAIRWTAAWPLALGLALAGEAAAHTGAHKKGPNFDYARAEEKDFGRAADPAKAARTITVALDDTMRFTPDAITVRKGDTVRFVVSNKGKVMHEMVLGTRRELEEHAQLMKKFPDMEHDEPHMAHVPPGKDGVMGWQFTKAGEFLYGCLVPGHFEAGMVGRIVVTEGGRP